MRFNDEWKQTLDVLGFNANSLTQEQLNEAATHLELVWRETDAKMFKLAVGGKRVEVVEVAEAPADEANEAFEERPYTQLDVQASETWSSIQDLAVAVQALVASSEHPIHAEMLAVIEHMEKLRSWTEGLATPRPG